MIMRMYNGLRNFLEFVIVESIQLTDVDAIRPNRSKQKYHIPASIAMIDGTEESFRPGGKVSIGDLYLQVLAGGVKAITVDEPKTQVILQLKQGDVVEYNGEFFEIFFWRDEPNICDIADYYAKKREVNSNVQ